MTDHIVTSGRSQGHTGRHSPKMKQAAIEQRRTHQRLSQRAYRARKDNKMSILTKRNNELEGAIEETSKSILELSDTLLQSTLLIQYPQAAQALRRVIENCLSPAQAGHLNSTAEGISEESSIYDRTQSNKLESSEQRGWWTGVFANVMLTETNNHSHPQSLVTDTSTSKHQLIQMPDTTKLTPYIGLSPVLSSNIFCYKGYSGFSKRLLQTCFLNGYQLLTDPFTNINKIIQVFGSQIGKIDQNRMTSFFRDALLEIGGNATEYQTPVSAVQDYEWNSYPKSLQDNYLYPREIPDKIQSSQELLNVYGVQDILLGRGIAIDSGTPTVQVWNATYSLIFDVKAFITFLSDAPICAGIEPLFPRYHVEAALQMAFVNNNEV